MNDAESRKHLGFTLAELLVVTMIMGLLAGILFPILSSAMKAPQQTVDLSTLRQYHLAWSIYTEDFGATPDDTAQFVAGSNFPTKLLSAQSDPNPRGTLNSLFDTPTKLWDKYPYRCSYVSRPDLRLTGFNWVPSDPMMQESQNVGISVVTAGRIGDGIGPVGKLFFQEGRYYRLLENGGVIHRDIQADLHSMKEFVPGGECWGLELLMMDPPKDLYHEYCQTLP